MTTPPRATPAEPPMEPSPIAVLRNALLWAARQRATAPHLVTEWSITRQDLAEVLAEYDRAVAAARRGAADTAIHNAALAWYWARQAMFGINRLPNDDGSLGEALIDAEGVLYKLVQSAARTPPPAEPPAPADSSTPETAR